MNFGPRCPDAYPEFVKRDPITTPAGRTDSKLLIHRQGGCASRGEWASQLRQMLCVA